jgi:hypothetical protein
MWRNRFEDLYYCEPRVGGSVEATLLPPSYHLRELQSQKR